MLMIVLAIVIAIVAFMFYSQWSKFREFRSKLMYALIASGLSHSEANNLYTRNTNIAHKMHQDGRGIGDILEALGVNRSMFDGLESAAEEMGYKGLHDVRVAQPKQLKPKTGFDSLINTLYGDNPPPRTAILSDSIQIAHVDLLLGVIPLKDVTEVAKTQFETGIPYSTYDLAFSVALYFFREHPNKQELFMAQLEAILILGDTVADGRLNPLIAETFQNYTYNAYHPDNQ